MKFGKTFEKTLAEDEIPQDWIANSCINYKQLKKELNAVVRELREHQLGAYQLGAVCRYYYEFDVGGRPGVSTVIRPLLRAEPTFQTPQTLQTLQAEPRLHSAEPNTLRAEPTLHSAELQADTGRGSAQLATLQADTGREPAEPQADAAVLNAQQQVLQADAAVLNAQQQVLQADAAVLNAHQLAAHQLEADARFFQHLYTQYLQFAAFSEHQTRIVSHSIADMASLIKQLTTNNKNVSDMYLWREIFNRYVEFKLGLDRNFTLANLNKFVRSIHDSALLKQSRHTKRNTLLLNQFVKLNIEIIKLKVFQNLNLIALKKIIKKFDKNTLIESSTNFNRLIAPDNVSQISNFSIETIVSTDLIKIVPQLDDYLCAICFTIAYKPVTLECGHFFCIRCLINLQRRNENKCPMCRAPVVLKACAVDDNLMHYMKANFPKEVKKKQRQNEKEANQDMMSSLYGSNDKCVVC